MLLFISISLPKRLLGSCLILVIFNVILLSFTTLLNCRDDKSNKEYLLFIFESNSSIVIVLFLSSSFKVYFTWSFVILYATGFLLYLLISPSLLYFSTHLIKLLGEHLNILQTSSCYLSSTK